MWGFAVVAMLALPQIVNAAEDARYASLVIDAETGAVLHQENAGKLRYPASLTKMMTLYVAFQALDRGTLTMNKKLQVSVHAANQKPSSIGLRPGQSISVKDAIDAVIIKSANDASVVLAEGVSGSEAQFALHMTRVAKKLGMNHTNFANASGLPNNKQVTTAYDLARLAVALRRDFAKYYPLFANNSFTYNGRTFYSHNRVTKSYRGADGLKTGYIRASGFNLVTSARRGGKSLVGVVMGGRSIKSRDTNMVKLLDQAFYKIAKNGTAGAQVLNTKPRLAEDNSSLSEVSSNDAAEEQKEVASSEEENSAFAESSTYNNVASSNHPVPVLKYTKSEIVDIPVPVRKANVDKNTKENTAFPRDVVVSNEMIAGSSVNANIKSSTKPRKDIFAAPIPKVEYYAENAPVAEASVEEVKVTRVMVKGKKVPVPTLKSSIDKGFVNTNISPRGSNKHADLHLAAN